MEHKNGTIVKSPFGHDVVRVPLSPSQDVYLATDQYRGWFTDEEVEGWEQSRTFHVENNENGAYMSKEFEDFSHASSVCRNLNTPGMGGLYGVYDDRGERVHTDPKED